MTATAGDTATTANAKTTDPFDETTDEATLEGQDPDKGKLFEVPRVAVTIDESDPSILKLAFSGNIELDRSVASDVELYNKLKAGSNADLSISVFVAGPKNTHRRDSEGDVDAVVQTKSLIVHSLETAG